MNRRITVLSAILGLTVAVTGMGQVFAHGDKHGKKTPPSSASAEAKPFGRAGDPAKVSRTIKMDMKDEMRFIPATLTVKQGETVRFVVRNTGKIMHEMVIGTMKDLKEHAALMQKFPNMEHDEPYMAHVKPGTTEEIVWQFSEAGEFNYACLVAGHFEAGMVGKVAVAPGAEKSAALK